jgi:hypothetical protein
MAGPARPQGQAHDDYHRYEVGCPSGQPVLGGAGTVPDPGKIVALVLGVWGYKQGRCSRTNTTSRRRFAEIGVAAGNGSRLHRRASQG